MKEKETDIKNQKLGEYFVDFLNKKELIKNCEIFGANIQSSWNKTLLANTLENKLLNEPQVLNMRIPLTEMLFLQKLVHAEGKLPIEDLFCIQYLEMRGLVKYQKNKDNKAYYSLSENFRKALDPIIDNLVKDVNLIEWDRKERLICGLTNLYGVLSQKDLYYKYLELSGEKISKPQFYDYILLRDRLHFGVKTFLKRKDIYFASEHIVYPQEILDQINKRKDLYQHKFTEKEVLETGIRFYIPKTQEAQSLINTLTKSGTTPYDIRVIIHSSWALIENEAPMSNILSLFSKKANVGSMDKINAFITQISEYLNSLPRWTLKGNSPKELFKEAHKPQNIFPQTPLNIDSITAASYSVKLTTRVGRNDLCPCGSGKKYKKCCGRDN